MTRAPDPRRKHSRVAVRITAGIYTKSQPDRCIDAEILDLSVGGAFIHCTTPIMLGEELLLEIRFDETQLFEGRVILTDDKSVKPSKGTISEKAVIKWARGSSRSGFGVEFTDLNDEHREFLVKLVQYLQDKAVASTVKPK